MVAPCCAVFRVLAVLRGFFQSVHNCPLALVFRHSSRSARKLCLQSWVQLRQVSLYVLRPVLGCRKNAHSIFAFLGNLGIVLTFFLLDFCLPFSPNVVPAPCQAALLRSYRRKVISHSDGHSIVKVHKSLLLTNWEKFFDLNEKLFRILDLILSLINWEIFREFGKVIFGEVSHLL